MSDDTKDPISVHTSSKEPDAVHSSLPLPQEHDVAPQDQRETGDNGETAQPLEKKKGFLSYFRTKEFYFVLLLG